MSRAEFLKLPMEERRKILEAQADKLIAAEASEAERETLSRLAAAQSAKILRALQSYE